MTLSTELSGLVERLRATTPSPLHLTGTPTETYRNPTGLEAADTIIAQAEALEVARQPKVHNKRAGTAPVGAVYIGRGTPWGNPFRLGEHGSRDEVCDRYEREILPTLDLAPLRGKHLVCWCKPARCHGDSILAELEK